LGEITAVNYSKISVNCNESLYVTPYQMFLRNLTRTLLTLKI